MSVPADLREQADRDAALDASIRVFVPSDANFGGAIVDIKKQPSQYRSSFALEEIAVLFDDGHRVTMMFKDLAWKLLTAAGQRAKPEFLYDPMREIEVYRHVLSKRPLGSPQCYGTVVVPKLDRYWLFVEKAPGAELYQYGELDVWCDAARWLGRMHGDPSVAVAAKSTPAADRLLRYDAAFIRRWMDRAVEFAANRHDASGRKAITALAARYGDVAEFLAALPKSFIHGEFYASNVLVEPSGDRVRVCPVDWELASFGPGAIDLAALIVGKWTDEQRATMVSTYREAMPTGHAWQTDRAALDRALMFARLHLAVQWLGWSAHWNPPAAHAQDWLGEAIRLGEELGLL